MSDDEAARLIQQIFRVNPEELAAFKAEAEACHMPLSHWYVQSCRVQAGLAAFTPAKRAHRPKPPAPAEPKRRGRPPKAAEAPRAPAATRKADPAVRAKLATMIAGATPPRPSAREVKP